MAALAEQPVSADALPHGGARDDDDELQQPHLQHVEVHPALQEDHAEKPVDDFARAAEISQDHPFDDGVLHADQGGEQVTLLLPRLLQEIGNGELLDALLPPLGDVLDIAHAVGGGKVEEHVRAPAQPLGGDHPETQP